MATSKCCGGPVRYNSYGKICVVCGRPCALAEPDEAGGDVFDADNTKTPEEVERIVEDFRARGLTPPQSGDEPKVDLEAAIQRMSELHANWRSCDPSMRKEELRTEFNRLALAHWQEFAAYLRSRSRVDYRKAAWMACVELGLTGTRQPTNNIHLAVAAAIQRAIEGDGP